MIDTHVHLASNDLGTYPHGENLAFRTEPYVHTAEHLVAAMAEAGVTAATIVQPFGIYGVDNSYHADSAAQSGGVLIGVCGVPVTADGPDVLRYWVQQRGMGGGRLITLGQGLSLDNAGLLQVCRTAQELGVPLCVLTSRKHLDDLPTLARRVPELRLVLDHAGMTGSLTEPDEVIRALTGLVAVESVFFKVSTSMLTSGPGGRQILEFLLGRAGVERILWGSNYPVTNLGTYASTVQASRDVLAFLSVDERARVFSGTARQLWAKLDAVADE